MTHDTLLRAGAVVAAAALVAAPYRYVVAGWLAKAAEAAGKHRATIGRVVAAGLLIAAAWGKIPLPAFPTQTVKVEVEVPTKEMQQLVEPVAVALASLPDADRNLWAATWAKAGVVVASDAVSSEVVLRDTRALRSYTALALDIAWRRIGGHAPGSVDGLREAVEAAYTSVLGTDEATVTADMRAKYQALANAFAWAGVR